MSKSIKGTQTEKNLLTSFAGESQSKNALHLFCKCGKERGLRANLRYLYRNGRSGEKNMQNVCLSF